MEKTIDARGQSSSKPLIMAQDILKTLRKNDRLNIVVDNLISAQNLEKMAGQLNLPTKKIQQGSDYIVSMFLQKTFVVPQQEDIPANTMPTNTDFVVVINNEVMGNGDYKLGTILIKSFIYSLTNLDKLPNSIIFYNSGVKLLVTNSEVIDDLRRLQDMGVEILVSKTCAEYYRLKDDLALGELVNMPSIIEKQISASKIIKP